MTNDAHSKAIVKENYSDRFEIVQDYFLPRVLVITSDAVCEVIRENYNQYDGILGVLQPFCLHLARSVITKNSKATSVCLDRFGVRLIGLETFTEALASDNESASLAELEDSLENLSHIDENDIKKHNHLQGLYNNLLQRLLSGSTLVAHETFGHPVCTMFLIMADECDYDDILLRLSKRALASAPDYVNHSNLQYYVMVHIEGKHDHTQSLKAFEQLKRAFGLHSHFLRLYGSQDGTSSNCISESDIANINNMMHEMVQQSILPSMETCIRTWNEQIAYRRGFTGSFFNVSRKFGFGINRGTEERSASGNFDYNKGYYPINSHEVQIHRLADYAFMLHDYQLAHSTYDILKRDYTNDKAWKHLAGAQGMVAMSILMKSVHQADCKPRFDLIDTALDSTLYSYLSRTTSPVSALRSLCCAIEMLDCPSSLYRASDLAARWAMRLLGSGLLGTLGSTLIIMRIIDCYRGHHHRKAAFWKVLASERWAAMNNYPTARICLQEADNYYSTLHNYTDWKLIHAHVKQIAERTNLELRHSCDEQVRIDFE